jgi:hypothetical protein
MEKSYNTTPSEMYRLMIYFAHSTFCIYQKTIKCNEKMSINDFRNENELVVKRVFDEALSIFNYELSYEQMNRAIRVYFQSKLYPSSVIETKTFQMSDGFYCADWNRCGSICEEQCPACKKADRAELL